MTQRDIEEEAIIAMIMMRAKAIGEKDAKDALSFHTDDCVEFSLAPPLVYHGKHEAGLQAWFDSWEGAIGGDVQDVKLTIGTDVPFWSGLVNMTGTKTDGTIVDFVVPSNPGSGEARRAMAGRAPARFRSIRNGWQ